MHSPHKFSLQSRNLPFISLTRVSLTMIVHLPIPDSPLVLVRIVKLVARRNSPMSYRHKRPVFIPSWEGIVRPCSRDMTCYSSWTSKFDAQIPSASVIYVHGDGNMFEALQVCFLQHIACDIEITCKTLVAFRDLVLHS